METKILAVIILAVIVFIFVCWHYQHEGFANKQEKANAIFTWFNNNPDPTYNSYARDLKNESNIVEYEDVLSLFRQKNLTVSSIAKVL